MRSVLAEGKIRALEGTTSRQYFQSITSPVPPGGPNHMSSSCEITWHVNDQIYPGQINVVCVTSFQLNTIGTVVLREITRMSMKCVTMQICSGQINVVCVASSPLNTIDPVVHPFGVYLPDLAISYLRYLQDPVWSPTYNTYVCRNNIFRKELVTTGRRLSRRPVAD